MMASSFSFNEPVDITNYSSMTVTELKAVAKELEITGYSSMTKAELIEVIEDATREN